MGLAVPSGSSRAENVLLIFPESKVIISSRPPGWNFIGKSDCAHTMLTINLSEREPPSSPRPWPDENKRVFQKCGPFTWLSSLDVQGAELC